MTARTTSTVNGSCSALVHLLLRAPAGCTRKFLDHFACGADNVLGTFGVRGPASLVTCPKCRLAAEAAA